MRKPTRLNHTQRAVARSGMQRADIHAGPKDPKPITSFDQFLAELREAAETFPIKVDRDGYVRHWNGDYRSCPIEVVLMARGIDGPAFGSAGRVLFGAEAGKFGTTTELQSAIMRAADNREDSDIRAALVAVAEGA